MCQIRGVVCPGYEEKWLHGSLGELPNPYPTPPSGTPIATLKTDTEFKISPTRSTPSFTRQLSCPESSEPSQGVRQDSSDLPQSCSSMIRYQCLHPLCTAEFQDYTSLVLHVKEHFKENPAIEQSCGRNEIEVGCNKDISQCSAYRLSMCWPWVTEINEQSPYPVTLPPAINNINEQSPYPVTLPLAINNVELMNENFLSPISSSDSRPSSLCLSDISTLTTDDYHTFSSRPIDGGFCAGQQRSNTQGDDYRRGISNNWAAQSLCNRLHVGNCAEPLDATLLHHSPTVTGVNVDSENPFTCPSPASEVFFEKYEHLQR